MKQNKRVSNDQISCFDKALKGRNGSARSQCHEGGATTLRRKGSIIMITKYEKQISSVSQ